MATVEEYFGDVGEAEKAEHERVKKIVKEVVPEAEESISYGIPTFKYKGKSILFFGVFKDHLSIFPGAAVRLKDELKGYKMSKGTIQFTTDKPLPEAVIKEILLARLKAVSKKSQS